MEVTLRIKRYNPEVDDKPVFREYRVDVEKTDRVLDALNKIKWQTDGTLTYRRSCAHGICGSDAMRINGRNRLACKILMGEVGDRVTIEPLIGFSVIKDLVVDLEDFFAGYRSIKPYLITHDEDPTEERRQSRPSGSGSTTPQVHSVRVVHLFLPDHLDQRGVCRASRHRQCPSVHLR